MIQLTADPIDVARLITIVSRRSCGAVVAFCGTVRDPSGGERIRGVEYEAYPPMGKRMLARIEGEIRQRWGVEEVALVHRLGNLAPGEISVATVVAAPHRAEAFAACQYAIDRIKEVVPIWKKEHATSGARWGGSGARGGDEAS